MGEIAVIPGLHFGFSVLCQAPIDWERVSPFAGIGVEVFAYVPGQPAAEGVWYVLDHGSFFPWYGSDPPYTKVIYLGSSGTYSVDLWQDLSSALGKSPPAGTRVSIIELHVRSDDWFYGPTPYEPGVPDYCPIAATFDDLWIGQGTSHNLMVTASANPATVPNRGTTQLSASASDSAGHTITSWKWSDNGAGGVFTPSAAVKNPTWKAPGHTGTGPVQRRLTVTATCGGSPSVSASDMVIVTEKSGVPSNVSLSPTSGVFAVGDKYTFSSKYSDPDGWNNLANCYLLINTTLDPANAVFLRYDANENKLYLKDDAGSVWLGGYAPGSGYSIPNSQGILYCSGTTIGKSGNVLTVNWRISFKPKMSGKICSAWMLVFDDTSLRDGYDKMGENIKISYRPQIISLSPNTGSFATDTRYFFTTVYADPDGPANLANCYLLINTTLNQKGAVVFVRYDQNTNLLYLKDDIDWSWGDGYPPGSDEVLSNSKCYVYCKDTTVTPMGTRLIIKWSIEFSSFTSGWNCGAWMLAFDDFGLRVGYLQMGRDIKLSQAPFNFSLDPNSGPLPIQQPVTLTSIYSDSDGFDNLAECFLLINDTLNPVDAAFVKYDANANLLYVKNDANTDWGTGAPPGADVILSNSQCMLYCAETTVEDGWAGMWISWRIEFLPTMAGTNGAWMLVYDDMRVRDGYDRMATFSIQ
jgi:hypothetical protein